MFSPGVAIAGDAVAPAVHFPTPADLPARWPQPTAAPRGAPNVLVIMTDDVGFAASSTFGGVIPTPTLDSLARAGLRYNNFNTTAMCSPTRASLLTGRNSHAVGMGALSDLAAGWDGYTSVIPRSAATIARILTDHGYSTAMFGKGHITPPWELSAAGPFDHWPTGLGFQYFYGFLNGDTNQWAPLLVENTRYVLPPANDPSYILERDLADHAIRWLHEQRAVAPERPFFIYFAPGATHAPHHAPADWIARFRGQFDAGWDAVRERIFERQRAAGVIPPSARLTPRPAELPAWDTLSEPEKRVAARFMEAYAAQLAFSDAQTGRLLEALRDSGEAERTLVIFIEGDNGASGEGGLRGTLFEQSLNLGVPEDPDYVLAHIDDIGSPLSDNMYPAGWAWAMNTPFQWFKQDASHFGGTRNGLVIAWPGHLGDLARVRSQFAHVSDIAPTILEAAGIEAPGNVGGIPQQPLDGLSLAYTFERADVPARRNTQYFEILQNVSIYHDGWIAATRPLFMPWQLFAPAAAALPLTERRWELYHVAEDFSESVDLAAQEPAHLRALQALFLKEGERNHVFPTHAPREGSQGRPHAPIRSDYVYSNETTQVYVDAAPQLGGRSFEIRADIVIPRGGASGVIIAQGGRFGGFSLYLRDGRPAFAYNALPPRISIIRAAEALAPGPHRIVTHFRSDGGPSGSGGALTIEADGRELASGRISYTLPRFWFSDGLDVGRDLLTPVSLDYASPAPFTGRIDSVTLHVE